MNDESEQLMTQSSPHKVDVNKVSDGSLNTAQVNSDTKLEELSGAECASFLSNVTPDLSECSIKTQGLPCVPKGRLECWRQLIYKDLLTGNKV